MSILKIPFFKEQEPKTAPLAPSQEGQKKYTDLLKERNAVKQAADAEKQGGGIFNKPKGALPSLARRDFVSLEELKEMAKKSDFRASGMSGNSAWQAKQREQLVEDFWNKVNPSNKYISEKDFDIKFKDFQAKYVKQLQYTIKRDKDYYKNLSEAKKQADNVVGLLNKLNPKQEKLSRGFSANVAAGVASPKKKSFFRWLVEKPQ